MLELARSLTLLQQVARTCAQCLQKRQTKEVERRARQARRRQALLRRFDQEWEAVNAEVQAAWQERKAVWEQYAQRRRQEIEAVIDRARRRLETSLEEAAGRAKYRLQRDRLQIARQRENALAEAQRVYEQVQAELEAEESVLTALETLAAVLLSSYGAWRRLAARQTVPETGEIPEAFQEQLESLRRWLAEAESAMARLRLLLLPVVFRYAPLWLWLVLAVAGHAVAVYVLPELGFAGWPLPTALRSLGCWIAAAVVLWLAGRQWGVGPVRRLGRALAAARHTLEKIRAAASARHQAQIQHIQTQAAEADAALERDYEAALAAVAERHERETRSLEERITRLRKRWERVAGQRETGIHAGREAAMAARRTDWETRRRAALAELDAEEAEAAREEQTAWEARVAQWRTQWEQAMQVVAAAEAADPQFSPAWEELAQPDRPLPQLMPRRVSVGRFEVSWPGLWGELPEGFPLPTPEKTTAVLPMALGLPEAGNVVVESDGNARDEAIATLEAMVLRLLSALPPGRADFTLLDPVELGKSFAALMHLADEHERLINHRIWTQTSQIEDRLGDLNSHIEKVTQMYLRNEYADIAAYNARAGRMAEKYRFLVVADFPHGFSELAVQRLRSILASGPKCGVFVLLHRDRRQPLPSGWTETDLERRCALLRGVGSRWRLSVAPLEGVKVLPDTLPPQAVETALLRKVGRASVDASRVEVPFEFVAPRPEEFWTGDASGGLSVPIGLTGATRRQRLSLGEGTKQHVLIAGKTGSGKSNLFHVIIQSVAFWYRPDEVEFYLVDFKKGVEFKCYARHRLPHARVVAIQSDREFGLSVLHRVDEELRRRGERFRRLGVQDLAAFRRAAPAEKMPRILLIIDEFQEFFVEDDRISQNAAMLLDRLVRQGRAFGIHVILGSQTLGGAYTLARSTLGQMVVRIALQCNEADALLILDEDNPAPRLLSRPGEAVYNDAAGRIEGNSPFQIVLLDEATREANLARIHARAEADGFRDRSPVVFEGNAPAEVEENRELTTVLATPNPLGSAAPRIWLGAPNAIKGPTEAVFERQSGNHLLVVGQRDEAILAMLGVAAVALAAQYPPGGVQVWVLTRTPPDSAERRFWQQVQAVAPSSIRLAAGASAEQAWPACAAELERRLGDPEFAEQAPPWFLVVHELHKFPELRQPDEFALSLDSDKADTEPADLFRRLIEEGPSHGMHIICSCDAVSSLGRFLTRKLQGQFEMRVAFQMSANDSAILLDSPQANLLGLHRAIFFDAREGILETFRPYALPGEGWLENARTALGRRTPQQSSRRSTTV